MTQTLLLVNCLGRILLSQLHPMELVLKQNSFFAYHYLNYFIVYFKKND